MSEVICFRLDPNNPREAQALAFLIQRQEQGYSIRNTMVEAILGFAGQGDDRLKFLIGELHSVLGDAQELVKDMQTRQMTTSAPPVETDNTSGANLSEGFLVAVKKAAKPGLRTG